MPHRHSRCPRRPWLAGLLVLTLVLGYLGVWQAAVENATGGPWAGIGDALLMMYVGTPVTAVLAGCALRLAGAASAVTGVGLLLLVLLVVPQIPGAAFLPGPVWPLLLAGAAAGYVRYEEFAPAE